MHKNKIQTFNKAEKTRIKAYNDYISKICIEENKQKCDQFLVKMTKMKIPSFNEVHTVDVIPKPFINYEKNRLLNALKENLSELIFTIQSMLIKFAVWLSMSFILSVLLEFVARYLYFVIDEFALNSGRYRIERDLAFELDALQNCCNNSQCNNFNHILHY